MMRAGHSSGSSLRRSANAYALSIGAVPCKFASEPAPALALVHGLLEARRVADPGSPRCGDACIEKHVRKAPVPGPLNAMCRALRQFASATSRSGWNETWTIRQAINNGNHWGEPQRDRSDSLSWCGRFAGLREKEASVSNRRARELSVGQPTARLDGRTAARLAFPPG